MYQEAQEKDREAVGQRRDSGSQATSSHDTSKAANPHTAGKILEGLVRLVWSVVCDLLFIDHWP